MLGTDLLVNSSQQTTEQDFVAPFYECTQSNIRFSFYINAIGNLRAKVLLGGTLEDALLIKDLPKEWQSHLNTPIQKKRLKELLQRSSFLIAI
jgi:hypothetical protein